MDTNKRLLNVDDIFMMKGRPDGWAPDDLEYEQAQKTADDFNRKMLEAMLPKELPKYMSLTNEADGSVVRGIMEQGKFREIPVDKINTQQGMFTMSNPTNAAPIVDPRTGQQVMGYAADPYAGSPAPAPMAGGGAYAGTNAPTASPSPTPYPEGAKIRNRRDGMIYQVVNGVPQLIPGQ